MIKGMLGALGAGYKLIDSLSGGKISKFAVKNVGKATGWAANKVLSHKPEWKQKITEVIGKAGDIIGDDNEIGKNLHNASNEMSGREVQWRAYDDGDKVPSVSPVVTALQPYNKNLGGTNYQRYRPRFSRSGSRQFSRVRVKNAVKPANRGKFRKKDSGKRAKPV